LHRDDRLRRRLRQSHRHEHAGRPCAGCGWRFGPGARPCWRRWRRRHGERRLRFRDPRRGRRRAPGSPPASPPGIGEQCAETSKQPNRCPSICCCWSIPPARWPKPAGQHQVDTGHRGAAGVRQGSALETGWAWAWGSSPSCRRKRPAPAAPSARRWPPGRGLSPAAPVREGRCRHPDPRQRL
jgi:hypothetical protein